MCMCEWSLHDCTCVCRLHDCTCVRRLHDCTGGRYMTMDVMFMRKGGTCVCVKRNGEVELV